MHLGDDSLLMLMNASLQTTASAYYSLAVVLERVLTGCLLALTSCSVLAKIPVGMGVQDLGGAGASSQFITDADSV